MCRRNAVEIEDLAVCGHAAVEFIAVPRGEADRLVIGIFSRNVGAAGDDIRRTDPVDTATLGHRLTIIDNARTWRNAVLRIDVAGAVGERKGDSRASTDRRQPA